jgi:transcriptional regulator with XRE-family HTH domain
MNQLGKLIKEFRLRKNLTQEQLAERSGISHRYVAKIENENKKPSVDVLGNLVHVLDIPTDYIFYPDSHSDRKVKYISELLRKCTDKEIDAVVALLESLASKS